MPWRNMHAMKWHREHLPEPLPAEPLELAASWLAEATRQKVQPNPNAMVLATSDASGQPSARVVLCKEILPHPGYLTFYTNYLSRKGRELHDNPRAADRPVLGRAASAGARRGSDRANARRRERCLLCDAQLAKPPGRLGKPAERTDRLAQRTAGQGGQGRAAPGATGARRRAAAGSRAAHCAPAALGRLPAVGRSRGTLGRGQRAHPRSGALAAHSERSEPMASTPVRGRSRGYSRSLSARRYRFHVAQHTPCDPGRDPVFCGGRQLAGSASHDRLAAHGAHRGVPGQRRRKCGRGGLHWRIGCGAAATGQRFRGARGAPLRRGNR